MKIADDGGVLKGSLLIEDRSDTLYGEASNESLINDDRLMAQELAA